MSRLNLEIRCGLIAVIAMLAGAACDPPAPARPRGATTPEDAQQIARALTSVVGRTVGGVTVGRTRSGADLVRFGRRFQEVAIAGHAADGSLRTACVSSAKEAEGFLVATPAAPDAGR